VKRPATPHETPKHPMGRPRVAIKPEQVSQLRNQGYSWRQIAKALGIGTATAMRLIRSLDEARPNTQHMSPKTADELKGTTLILKTNQRT
jgi:transposase